MNMTEREQQLETLRRKMHALVNAYIDNLHDDNNEMDDDDRDDKGTLLPSDAFADLAAIVETGEDVLDV